MNASTQHAANLLAQAEARQAQLQARDRREAAARREACYQAEVRETEARIAACIALEAQREAALRNTANFSLNQIVRGVNAGYFVILNTRVGPDFERWYDLKEVNPKDFSQTAPGGLSLPESALRNVY